MYKQQMPAEFLTRGRRFESINRMNTEAETNHDTVNKLEQELAVERERYLRLAADFDNYRKRMTREMDRRASSQKEALVLDLLPAVDNLERALTAKIRSEESFFKGVKMVFDQLVVFLKRHGFEARHDHGESFDEKFHDALAVGYDARRPDLSVLEVWERGWMRGTEMFRPAKVVVNDLKAEVKNAA